MGATANAGKWPNDDSFRVQTCTSITQTDCRPRSRFLLWWFRQHTTGHTSGNKEYKWWQWSRHKRWCP
jgi:hypothetical protein